MTAGRPTKYNKEVHQQTEWYLTNYKEVGDAIPSLAGLAYHLKVSRSTIYDWGKTHLEFSYILEDILTDQERVLLNKGLTNEFNSNITKLALGKHGYKDVTESSFTFDDENKEKANQLIKDFLDTKSDRD